MQIIDPTTLILIDEADRLRMASLEQVRAIFVTGANFRLLNRLLTQIERILEINALQQVTKTVVEAARDSLVIGAGLKRPEAMHSTFW